MAVFFFFLGWCWLFVFFFFLFLGWLFGFFFFISFDDLGTEKKMYRLTGIGPQIMWKILSDGNWVMMPNGCEKLSDEWWIMSYESWVMSDEWWKLSDEKWLAKQALRGCLVSVFKQQFLVFKQHFMYFNTLFHPHIFPQKFLNNNFQFLNTCTKQALKVFFFFLFIYYYFFFLSIEKRD